MTSDDDATKLAAAPSVLAASVRVRIVISLGVLLVLLGFGSPGGGLIELPISFLLKNGLGSAAACSGRNGPCYCGVEGSGR